MHGATEYLTHQSLKHSLGRASIYGSVVPLPALGKSQKASLAALNNWPVLSTLTGRWLCARAVLVRWISRRPGAAPELRASCSPLDETGRFAVIDLFGVGS
jgi:hypothetical protein